MCSCGQVRDSGQCVAVDRSETEVRVCSCGQVRQRSVCVAVDRPETPGTVVRVCCGQTRQRSVCAVDRPDGGQCVLWSVQTEVSV